MPEYFLVRLSAIIVLGIATQWIAWRLRLPAILLLLLAGIAAGAGTEWLAHHELWISARFLDPDALFGDLLLPTVSLAVALVLFEGGLTLNMRELSETGGVIARLVSVGAIVTWGLTTLAAYWVLQLDFPLAILLGAVLVVTGPTVIGPLLRHVRPSGPVGPILKWEGIVIDPLGAMLAVVVFEIISLGRLDAGSAIRTAIETTVVGCVLGIVCAVILVVFLKRAWIPDVLHNAATLMLVVAAFAAGNLLKHEAGLFSVTVMGLVLANQRHVSVRHIMEFKESLTVLLLSALFIVLGSRLSLDQIRTALSVRSVVFVVLLIVLVRPVAVALCTLRSKLPWNERVFLAAVAPRGIIAAAVSSVFALRLADTSHDGADRLVSLTFAVIIGTVTVYGLTAGWTARRLKLARPGKLGFLIVSADPFARALASVIQKEKHDVLLVDTNRFNIQAARLQGLPVIAGSAVSRQVTDRIELSSIGRLLAMTPNDDLNSFAALHFAPVFGRNRVYQLTPEQRSQRKDDSSQSHNGHLLFAATATHAHLIDAVERGWQVKKATLTKEFDLARFKATWGDATIPLLSMNESGVITIITADSPPSYKTGQSIVSLVPPQAATKVAPAEVSAVGG